ncbi:hypothetical protein HZH66_002623 [Vespula vulgaris]|uniref:Uncharacterized protein n=1 Tax=Vespula vulgaris TaxID=7454 RepID=A0A834KLI2_VESVU|nr:hypothetical protein HZH66_002623 [Vespula vulgaris]
MKDSARTRFKCFHQGALESSSWNKEELKRTRLAKTVGIRTTIQRTIEYFEVNYVEQGHGFLTCQDSTVSWLIFACRFNITSIVYGTPVINEEDFLGRILALCDLTRHLQGYYSGCGKAFCDKAVMLTSTLEDVAQRDTLLTHKSFPFKVCQGQAKINMVDAAAAAAAAAVAAAAAAAATAASVTAVATDHGRAHY